VHEAGKAGPTDAGFFSDLVPKKTEEGKAEPPAQAAEDTGIFSDLVPRQPVKIEEPTPIPEPTQPPVAEETPAPTDEGRAQIGYPTIQAPTPMPGLPTVEQQQQAQQAAQLQQGAQQAASSQAPLPTAQQAAQIAILESQTCAAPRPATPAHFAAASADPSALWAITSHTNPANQCANGNRVNCRASPDAKCKRAGS
jgi:hypothetical protein